ncbi:hypothetical protein DRB06_05880 [Actinomyces sp. Z5]|uniref:glycoside hydrolase 5 family protein n=1 Tax=Actinomyces sp. Z5 TaxID=2250216 RepID=UPI000DCB59C3|nr:cellulase family glycosylhydrolase [Actinomyces sp. Z5]RAX21486.1 hypothetical protein DRB06_05880 [Actinomyces sp. Z5]
MRVNPLNDGPGRFRMGPHFIYDQGRAVVPVGVHYVPRSGPDWPWRTGSGEFARAFRDIAAHGLDTVRIDLLWAALEPREGVLDEEHLKTLDRILDAAAANGLTLHPTLFVGGEVGDAYWDLPWASGINPHSDRHLLDAQCAHAARLAERWSGRRELIAWDLTDEPPFWIYGDSTSDEDARLWTHRLAESLRLNDPNHLITVGTASQEVDGGPFRCDVVADELDFCCVHPYPIYSPELYADRLESRRMTHAAAFETALARGAGKSVMIHEFGASSTQHAPDVIAHYDHLSCWSGFGAGAIGFYAWCWIDAEADAYGRAPYVRMPHETQFGLVDADNVPRPRLTSLSDLRACLAGFDLERCASDGPRALASIPVPREYAHPYAQENYGLDDAPAGPYVPSEQSWDSTRDVKPLIRGLLNAFVYSERAGMPVQFPRETLDDAWPTTPVTVLPAPLTSTTNSLLHVRTSFWQGASNYVADGGVLYLSLSAESAIPELHRFAGVRIKDRAPVDEDLRLTVVRPFGGFAVGDELSLPGGSADLHGRGVELEAEGAEVLARTAAGAPALTLFTRGDGAVVVSAYPLELMAAATPDAHDDDRVWRLYRFVRELSGCRLPVDLDDGELTRGVLTGNGGGMLVATNHGATAVEVPVQVHASSTVQSASLCVCSPERAAHPDFSQDIREGAMVTVPAFGTRIITWDAPPVDS